MIHHAEAISNGNPTSARPRGLHPDLFGPSGSGWRGVADKLCPMLAARRAEAGRPINVMFDRPGGNEPDGAISDRPFDLARGTPWSDKLCDRRALAEMLAACRVAGGGENVFYIGRTLQPHPDSVVIEMVRLGLVHGVIFDAMTTTTYEQRRPQIEAYRAAGAWVGSEAIPKYGQPDLYRDPDMRLCSAMHEWPVAQATYAQGTPHPNRVVHRLAVASKIVLWDIRDEVAEATRYATEFDVYANLLSAAWKGTRLPDAPYSE